MENQQSGQKSEDLPEQPLAGWHYQGSNARRALQALRQIDQDDTEHLQFTSFKNDGSKPAVPAAVSASPEQEQQQRQAELAVQAAEGTAISAKTEEQPPLYRSKLPSELQQRLNALDAEVSGHAVEEQDSRNTESRFYAKAMAALGRGGKDAAGGRGQSLKNKLRLYLIVIFLFACYYGYNEYLKPPTDPAVQLQESLPLQIDAHTTMASAQITADNVLLLIEQDPEALGALTVKDRDQVLAKIEANAPALCKNALLRSIIASGKSLTVLLRGTDGSYERRYTLRSCPLPAEPAP